MLPFPVTLVPGESPYRQVVYAATKAVVSGVMPPGAPFPSVRELSQALKINPNTAHKVVQELVRNGVLQVLPGVGTVVAEAARSSRAERRALLSTQVEQLVVEARRLGVREQDVLDAVSARWAELSGGSTSSRAASDDADELE
ncbi:MAG: GntR family transcriptional regulator [Gemmatimonadaceae bacterium]|nr:GntR family transcriptional regulator [Gemmatimonadaceae bacterium]